MRTEDIALTMIPRLGVKGTVHLLSLFGSAERIFAASADELTERAELRPDVARSITGRVSFEAAEREIAYCRRHGIRPVASTDPEYPPLMRESDDYPHVIYVCGEVGALSKRCVTFVGTRHMTSYGERICTKLIEELAETVPDLCIVSGMAYGIDGAAHRAALHCGVPTVGVLANVLPEVTPAHHALLGRDIIEHGGALVSELPSTTRQNGSYYISRNRIMAAMGCGTVVVESAAAGGSLATAHFADSCNRSVMAVPGRASDKYSAGTNMLIRNRKAQLVLSGEDIARELMWEMNIPAPERRPTEAAAALLPSEKAVMAAFGDEERVSADTLAARSGLDAGELAATMISLELSGAVRQLPGGMYERLIG